MPLMELTRKNNSFTRSSSVAKAFDKLKTTFTSNPLLVHANIEKLFVIEDDVPNFARGSALSRNGDGGKLYPVTLYCEMHIKGNQTNPASFILIIQYIEDTKVPILGRPSYTCSKMV